MGKLCHIHPIIITIVFHKGGIYFLFVCVCIADVCCCRCVLIFSILYCIWFIWSVAAGSLILFIHCAMRDGHKFARILSQSITDHVFSMNVFSTPAILSISRVRRTLCVDNTIVVGSTGCFVDGQTLPILWPHDAMDCVCVLLSLFLNSAVRVKCATSFEIFSIIIMAQLQPMGNHTANLAICRGYGKRPCGDGDICTACRGNNDMCWRQKCHYFHINQ